MSIHGFAYPQLAIEPASQIVFVGSSESLLATITLKNQGQDKKVAVKLKTNLPSNTISVKPKIALIEPMKQVSTYLVTVETVF